MGEAGQAHQDIELVGVGVLQHAPDKGGAKLRDGYRPGGAQDGVVGEAQILRGGEQAHGLRVVQADLLGVHPGEVLEHADHGRIVVAQHVQLE